MSREDQKALIMVSNLMWRNTTESIKEEYIIPPSKHEFIFLDLTGLLILFLLFVLFLLFFNHFINIKIINRNRTKSIQHLEPRR